jgi:hypothetical protein
MVLAQKTFSVRKNIHGKDGTPALTLVLAPLQLIFDTDTNGIVTTGSLAANTCSVKIAKGDTQVLPSAVTAKGVGCVANYSNGIIKVTSIDKDGAVSRGSGYVDVTAKYENKTFTDRLYWNVNIHKVVAGIEAKADTIEASVKGINTKMEDGKLTTKETEAVVKLAEEKVAIVVKGLKSAGIDVTTGAVTLFGDKVSVSNNGVQAVLFENGKLNANFIDAKKIVAEGIKAQTIDAENATFENVNVKGTIEADKGRIGGLDIRDYKLHGEPSIFSGWTIPSIWLGDHDKGQYVSLGDALPATSMLRGVARFEYNIKETNGYNDVHNNIALYLSSKGSGFETENNNIALYISAGTIKGFRLKVARIGARTYYIDKMDTFLVNTATTGYLNWYLPSDCEDGQVFYIVPNLGCTLALHCQGVDRIAKEKRYETRCVISNPSIHQFVYDAVNHIWFGGWQKMMD